MTDLSPIPIALAGFLGGREIARRIPGASRYFVTDSGRVFSTIKGVTEVKPYTQRYPQVGIWFDGPDGTTKRRVVYVHVLVALAFLGPRPVSPGVDYDVDHIDNDPLNNWPSNLRYLPKSENVQRAMRSGEHPKAKLSPAVVWTLRCRSHTEGDHAVIAETAEQLGMSATAVRAALAGRSWAWIPLPSSLPTAEELARALSIKSLDEARRLLARSPFAQATGRSQSAPLRMRQAA